MSSSKVPRESPVGGEGGRNAPIGVVPNDGDRAASAQPEAAQPSILSTNPVQWLRSPQHALIVVSVLLVAAVGAYLYWSWSSNRRIDAFHERARHPLQSACFFEQPAERGQHFRLPVGTFAWFTLGLGRVGSVKVPAGMTVEILSVASVAKVVSTVAAQGAAPMAADVATDAAGPSHKASALVAAESGAHGDAAAPPAAVEFRVVDAPAPFVCKGNATTDVSKIEWAQVAYIRVARAANRFV